MGFFSSTSKTKTKTKQALRFPEALPLFTAQTDLFRQALPFEQRGLQNLTALLEGREAPSIVNPLRSAVDQARTAFTGSSPIGTTFDFDGALRGAVNTMRAQAPSHLMGMGSALVSPEIARLANLITQSTQSRTTSTPSIFSVMAQLASLALLGGGAASGGGGGASMGNV